MCGVSFTKCVAHKERLQCKCFLMMTPVVLNFVKDLARTRAWQSLGGATTIYRPLVICLPSKGIALPQVPSTCLNRENVIKDVYWAKISQCH